MARVSYITQFWSFTEEKVTEFKGYSSQKVQGFTFSGPGSFVLAAALHHSSSMSTPTPYSLPWGLVDKYLLGGWRFHFLQELSRCNSGKGLCGVGKKLNPGSHFWGQICRAVNRTFCLSWVILQEERPLHLLFPLGIITGKGWCEPSAKVSDLPLLVSQLHQGSSLVSLKGFSAWFSLSKSTKGSWTLKPQKGFWSGCLFFFKWIWIWDVTHILQRDRKVWQ